MVSNGGNANFEALSYKVHSIFLLILKKFLYNFHRTKNADLVIFTEEIRNEKLNFLFHTVQ